MSRVKNIAIIVIAIAVLSVSVVSNAALLGWDLVDSGKHLDWDGNSKYATSISNGVGIWENYKSGVIRPDNAFRIQDVFLSDFNEVSNTMAVTSSGGTIKFNDYHYSGMTSAERTKTTTHEFGHALGLAHTYGTYDIMRQGKLSITTLSSTDKSSYDSAYSNY